MQYLWFPVKVKFGETTWENSGAVAGTVVSQQGDSGFNPRAYKGCLKVLWLGSECEAVSFGNIVHVMVDGR